MADAIRAEEDEAVIREAAEAVALTRHASWLAAAARYAEDIAGATQAVESSATEVTPSEEGPATTRAAEAVSTARPAAWVSSRQKGRGNRGWSAASRRGIFLSTAPRRGGAGERGRGRCRAGGGSAARDGRWRQCCEAARGQHRDDASRKCRRGRTKFAPKLKTARHVITTQVCLRLRLYAALQCGCGVVPGTCRQPKLVRRSTTIQSIIGHSS